MARVTAEKVEQSKRDLLQAAQEAAERLVLAFEHVHCGLGELESELAGRFSSWGDDQENLRLLA